jgi:hypothetical protein
MSKKSSVVLLCASSFILGAVLAFFVGRWEAMPVSSPPDPNFLSVGTTISRGAWGTIDELEIPLADSSDQFADRPARLRKTAWLFENYSKEQLETLLRSLDLSPSQWGMLQQTNVVTIGNDGILLQPPDEFVWALNPRARAMLYEELAKSGANYSQQSPFRFAPERLRERMTALKLSDEKEARIHSLLYTNGGFLCFADLQLLPAILTTNELDQASEAFYRVPSYRLRVRVYADSKIDDLIHYWGQHGREKFIRPLLESSARVPGRTNGTSVNVSFLMPPTARLRLFTYPDAWPDPDAERQDCFWTSFNFFRDPPDARFLDSKHNKEVLESEYHPVNAQPVFGDLVVLLDNKGNGLHACVYIADDFVFTKNGANRLQPWVMMKMSDMLAYFYSQKPNRVVIYRCKDTGKSLDEIPNGGVIVAGGRSRSR